MSLLWVRMIPERWGTCGSYDPGLFVLNASSLYGWVLHYCGGQKDRKGCITLLKHRQKLLWVCYESGQQDEIWNSLFAVCGEEIPFKWSSCWGVCSWASSCRCVYADVSPKLTVNTLTKENSQQRWWSLSFLRPHQGPAQACGLLPHKKTWHLSAEPSSACTGSSEMCISILQSRGKPQWRELAGEKM